MKDNRTYAIIRWNPGFDRQTFLEARKQGLFGGANVTFDSVRKSLDGKKAAVWWRGTTPQKLSGLILWQGTLGALLPQLQTAEWLTSKELALVALTASASPLAAGGVVGRFAAAITSAPASSWPKYVAWGTAAAAAVAGAAYLLGAF
jgi:hypothetical protein